ncbi:Sulfatase [Pseudovibrio axinellae]|uniref:Sulfatase n=1 Tax=Pseudovibrio axinellae TaxID=989403 RepID=A0A165YMH2_9HYPH|nr:sulfatase-like hydrolase/transferase [Pseudovibrio axinellae]KZL18985.1 Sulfatase [Pseudovibrio axinellae]SEP85103.1 Phosphoglycerol transferase MdoB [Pseudovibrio axinellae]
MTFSLPSAAIFVNRRLKSSESWRFAVFSIITPSFVYILSSIYYAPMRVSNILALGLVLFLGIFVHRFLFLLLLAFTMIVDGVLFSANYFQMSPMMIVDSVHYLNKLDLFASITYCAVFFFFLVSLIFTYRVTQRAKQNRKQLSLYPLFMVLFTYAGVDWTLNAPSHWELRTESFLSNPFDPVEDAATIRANLKQQITSTTQPDVLIVIVEGLGTFKEGRKQEQIWGPLLDTDLKETYSVQSGSTEYIGSTSSAEARELCNRLADYRDFRDRGTVACLPRIALASGYKTAAFHGFSGAFFERFDWYPKVGFQELNFLENYSGLKHANELPKCGITFEGLCDADVARAVNNFLHQEDSAPKFAYWLTLNSHKPVGSGEVPERLGCKNGGVFKDQELCRMAEQWLNISHLVKGIALDPRLRSTEVLLVGDHHPPLFTRHGRNQFEAGKVAWLHLKPINDNKRQIPATSPDRLSM